MNIHYKLMELCKNYHEYQKFPIDELDKGDYCSSQCAASEAYDILKNRFEKNLKEIKQLFKKEENK